MKRGVAEGASRAVLARKSKSFALAAKLLPARSRDDVALLYAYCRRADDAVDECPANEQAGRVTALRLELSAIYAGMAQSDPLLAAFQQLIVRYDIPREYPEALLDGLSTDIGRVRIATLDELLLYAHRVAGVVGLMLCHVFGLSDRGALRNADDLGIAMQLTNICRDVAEDWRRDRLYLPADVVRACSEQGSNAALEPLAAESRAGIARAIQRLLTIADRYYASGDAGLFALPFRVALAVRAARLIYAAIGQRLARQGFDVTAGRAVVPAWQKLLLAARAMLEESASRLRRRLSGREPLGLGARDGS